MTDDTLVVEQGQTAPQNSGAFTAQSNAAALTSLLDSLEDASLTQRDKGTRFERLCLDFLTHDKTYKDQFLKVQTFKDWALEHKDLATNGQDIGIDLVATNNPSLVNTANPAAQSEYSETFTAIQCKFYAKDATVPKSGIDSFISASAKGYFTQRLIIATNKEWSANVLKEIYDPHSMVPVNVLTRNELENSSIDWAKYQVDQSEIKYLKRVLRPYQESAVKDVIDGFRSYDRGKLIMACGTGKTFTALNIAERQAGPHGLVLFLVPSLSLLSQTLTDWKNYSSVPITAFAVCSDSKVGKNTEDRDLTSKDELAYPATTDPLKLAESVRNVGMQANNEGLVELINPDTLAEDKLGMTVIFSTYQSIDVVAVAQHKYGLPEFDLVICDEAHRTTGCYDIGQADGAKQSKTTPMTITIEENSQAADSAVQSYEATSESAPETKKRNKRKKSQLDVVDNNVSYFNFVHNQDYLRAKKRLYMTATPKIYKDRDNTKGQDGVNYDVFSMDDETIYGPVFHVLNFSTAIQLGCLVDYKVLILVMDGHNFKHSDLITEINSVNQARMVGAWKALNKYGALEDLQDDPLPIKRAVGFAQIIDSNKPDKVASKKLTKRFQDVIDHYIEHVEEDCKSDQASDFLKSELKFLQERPLKCVCEHIDGQMDAVQKSAKLDWLRAEPAANQTKILFNVRCLSEGVDVPALDAVIFFSPRKSQVDVVQSVGRVMRTAPGKKRGYIILPVVVNNPDDLEDTINRTPEYKAIWDVLLALKSLHPEEELFDPTLNKLDKRIQIVCEHDLMAKSASTASGARKPKKDSDSDQEFGEQTMLMLDDMSLVELIKSAVINKLGNRKSWALWASDVAQICQDQGAAIEKHLKESPSMQETFDGFKAELSNTLRTNISDQEVIDMLSQHIVVKPVMDELFKGFPFTEKNPIAHAMSKMLSLLDQDGLIKTNRQLKEFYDSVALRMRQVTELKDRQAVIIELFDNFFKKAFPKQQEKLGIVYTPVEVVDFINHSINDILQREFGQSLAAPNVHILDPFTGTGTFITRMLLDDQLIPDDALERKYSQELHAYELMPLAYYVASINMESAFVERKGIGADQYQPNNITVLTDTFADKRDLNSAEDVLVNVDVDLARNNQLRDNVEKQPLWVILGNPPYSIGQKNQNDDNQNNDYPALEASIANTYAKKSGDKQFKKSLYDSYVKAFRWASDKLGKQGIIAFVSNASWLDSLSTSGMRCCISAEFSSIYIYHLKGDQRTSRERSDKEGGKIFGSGSRTPIAITFLVKNPQAQEQGKIFFGCVDDYLSREDKLQQLVKLGSICQAPLVEVHQDEHGDWFNHRRDDFSHFIAMDGKRNEGLSLFSNFSNGIFTSRDSWSYNASRDVLSDNFTSCIGFYNSQVDEAIRLSDAFERCNDPTKIKWDRPQKAHVLKGKYYQPFSERYIVTSLYRPFFKEFLYNDSAWINCQYQMSKLFPFDGAQNLTIDLSGVSAKSFSCLMADRITCLDCVEKSQCFPRYVYRKLDESTQDNQYEKASNLLSAIEDKPANEQAVVVNGYAREDAIKPEAVEHFRQAYPDHAGDIDADSIFYYIYGLLHSTEYRSTYSNNLQKELPRIPRMATYEGFAAFEQAGRQLAKLHVGYESVEPYSGCTIEQSQIVPNYKVTQMKYGKIAGKTGNASKDKTVIHFNDDITIRGIPLEAQEYVVNKKSALDWVVERCCISQDKESKIINNYNDYAREVGDEKYIFNLVLRVITVSLETMKIVKALPKLDIHPLDK